MPPTETGFGVGATKRSVKTPKRVQYGAFSTTIGFAVSQGNVRVTVTALSGTKSGDVTITYKLTNPRANTASITPEYSKDGGTTFATATKGTGGDAITTLTTSSGGTTHTFVWDTVTDVGIDFIGTTFFRIKAYDLDNQGGDFETSESGNKIAIDNAPAAPTVNHPTEDHFDKNETPTYRADIPSPVEGDSDMHVKLEIDPTDTFDSATDGKGNRTPLKTFESRLDNVGWEYNSDGAGAWLRIPNAGLPIVTTPALIGREVRFTIPTEKKLDAGDYKQRWIFGGVLS